MVAPSNTSRIASSALAMTLFIEGILNQVHQGGTKTRNLRLRIFNPNWNYGHSVADSFVPTTKSELSPCLCVAAVDSSQWCALSNSAANSRESRILPDMRQALLQFEECIAKIPLVGDGDIAHMSTDSMKSVSSPQRASARLEQGRVFAKFIHQRAARAVEIICGKWLIQAHS